MILIPSIAEMFTLFNFSHSLLILSSDLQHTLSKVTALKVTGHNDIQEAQGEPRDVVIDALK